MKIKDIMSINLVVANSKDTICTVSNLMKNNDIGFIPVADDNHVIGVVTDRDIVIRAISENIKLDNSICDIMTTHIFTLNENSDLNSALKLMSDKQIKRLLVLDNKRIVGIISLSDIIKISTDNNRIIKCMKKINENNNELINYESEIDEFYL